MTLGNCSGGITMKNRRPRVYKTGNTGFANRDIYKYEVTKYESSLYESLFRDQSVFLHL